MAYFFSVLGLVLVIEGMPYFAFPDKMKKLLEKLPSIPNSVLRIFGGVSIAAGLIMLYVSRNLG